MPLPQHLQQKNKEESTSQKVSVTPSSIMAASTSVTATPSKEEGTTQKAPATPTSTIAASTAASKTASTATGTVEPTKTQSQTQTTAPTTAAGPATSEAPKVSSQDVSKLAEKLNTIVDSVEDENLKQNLQSLQSDLVKLAETLKKLGLARRKRNTQDQGCDCTLLAEALSTVKKSLESINNAKTTCSRTDITCP